MYHFGTFALSMAVQIGKDTCFIAYSMQDDGYALPRRYPAIDGESVSVPKARSHVYYKSC